MSLRKWSKGRWGFRSRRTTDPEVFVPPEQQCSVCEARKRYRPLTSSVEQSVADWCHFLGFRQADESDNDHQIWVSPHVSDGDLEQVEGPEYQITYGVDASSGALALVRLVRLSVGSEVDASPEPNQP